MGEDAAPPAHRPGRVRTCSPARSGAPGARGRVDVSGRESRRIPASPRSDRGAFRRRKRSRRHRGRMLRAPTSSARRRPPRRRGRRRHREARATIRCWPRPAPRSAGPFLRSPLRGGLRARRPAAVEAALTPEKTKLVIVSNPHNPSGVLARGAKTSPISPAWRSDRRARARRRGLSGDASSKTVRRPAAPSPPCSSPSNSLTKSYGLASLRCGWTLASPDATRRIRRARDVVDVSGPLPAERLALAAFRNLDALEARARAILDPNRRRARESLGAWRPTRVRPVRGVARLPAVPGRSRARRPSRESSSSGKAWRSSPGSSSGCPPTSALSLGGSPERSARASKPSGRHSTVL